MAVIEWMVRKMEWRNKDCRQSKSHSKKHKDKYLTAFPSHIFDILFAKKKKIKICGERKVGQVLGSLFLLSPYFSEVIKI